MTGANFRDAKSGDMLLSLDNCVSIGSAWFSSLSFEDSILKIAGNVSMVDAAICPDSSSLYNTSYNDQFNGKIAIWMYPSVTDESCVSNFFYPYEMYERLVNAEAAGLVLLEDSSKTEPGMWQTEFSTLKLSRFYAENGESPSKKSIPFIHCGLTHPGQNLKSTTEELNIFLQNIYQVETNTDTYPNGIFADFNVTPVSAWFKMFDSTYYQFSFRAIFGIVFVRLSLMSLSKLIRRKKYYETSKFFTPPTIALIIELISNTILASYFIIDGMWSISDSNFAWARRIILTEFTFFSASSSMLIILNMADTRKKILRHANTSTLYLRYRKGTYVLVTIMASCEILFGLLGKVKSTTAVHVAVGFGTVIAYCCEIYFFRSILKYYESRNYSAVHRTTLATLVVYNNLYWCKVAVVSLFFVTLLFGLMVSMEWLIWAPMRWYVLYLVLTSLRAIHSAAKIKLCQTRKRRVDAKSTEYRSTKPTNESGAVSPVPLLRDTKTSN